MCQAVKSLSLATRCFAVDTWKGDEHTGFYSEEVYRDFLEFHDGRYAAFSRLVRSTFDEALPHFEKQSIDLLHIDGLHTYEAVRHDFDSWAPKLSDNSIVIFHDINVRERGFGAFQLWSELCSHLPHFTFLHGHGLGVLGFGSNYPLRLSLLFSAAEDDCVTGAIRAVFAQLGRSLESSEAIKSLREEITALHGSTSWRITAPLRKDWIRTLRRVADKKLWQSIGGLPFGPYVHQFFHNSLNRTQPLDVAGARPKRPSTEANRLQDHWAVEGQGENTQRGGSAPLAR